MHMMYGNYWGGGFFPGFGFSWFSIFLILGVIFLLWALFSHHDKNHDEEMGEEDTAIQILRERYAKGDITKRQFDAMKKDLM